MIHLNLSRGALGVCVASALLSGCGGSPPIGAPGAMPQVPALSARANSTSYKIVHSFSGFPSGDGVFPAASLIDVGGTLYGTTPYGGSVYCYGNPDNSCGTVYSITTGGTEQVLYSFGHRKDGRFPMAPLIEVKGKLYGTTWGGGARHEGTVFSITTGGTEHVLYNFVGGPGEGPGDGGEPQAPLLEVNGTLYGTTYYGGAYAGGTVFSITPSGSEKVLHSFGNGTDGIRPEAGLIDVGGTLYGTTADGGKGGRGTVFSITPSGSEKVLHSFARRNGTDGAYPSASLIALNGTLYSTTCCGGIYDKCGRRGACGGSVFSITPSGREKVLHSFGNGTDGALPGASLIARRGTLYGTTTSGGDSTYCGSGCGTVFSITTGGTEKVLWSFGNASDGYAVDPDAALVDVNGTLYGTTYGGGTEQWGTVFALKP